MNPLETANNHKKHNIIGLLRVKARILALEKISASFQFLLHSDLTPNNEGGSFFASIIAKTIEEMLMATEPGLLKIFYEYLSIEESIQDIIMEETKIVLDNISGVGKRFAKETESLINSAIGELFEWDAPFNFDIDELLIEHLAIIDSPYTFYPSYKILDGDVSVPNDIINSTFGRANDKISYNSMIQESFAKSGILHQVAPNTHYIVDRKGAYGPLEYGWKDDDGGGYWSDDEDLDDSVIKDKGWVTKDLIPFFRRTFYLERFIDVEFEDGQKWVINFDYFVNNAYTTEEDGKFTVYLAPDPAISDTDQKLVSTAAVGLRLMAVSPTLNSVLDGAETVDCKKEYESFVGSEVALDGDDFSELSDLVLELDGADTLEKKQVLISEINENIITIIDKKLKNPIKVSFGSSPWGHFTEKTWQHAMRNKEYFRMELVKPRWMPEEPLDETAELSGFLDDNIEETSDLFQKHEDALIIYHPIEIARTTILESDLQGGTFEELIEAGENLFTYWNENKNIDEFVTPNGKSIFNHLRNENPRLTAGDSGPDSLDSVSSFNEDHTFLLDTPDGEAEMIVDDELYKIIFKTDGNKKILWNELTEKNYAQEKKNVTGVPAVVDGFTKKTFFPQVDYYVALEGWKTLGTWIPGKVPTITQNLGADITVDHMKGARLTTEELTFYGDGTTPPEDVPDGPFGGGEFSGGFARDKANVIHNWTMENRKTGDIMDVGPSHDGYGWLNTLRLSEDIREVKKLLENEQDKLKSINILAYDRANLKNALDKIATMFIDYEVHFCRVLEGDGDVGEGATAPGASPWTPQLFNFVEGPPMSGKFGNNKQSAYIGPLGFLKRRASLEFESGKWNDWPALKQTTGAFLSDDDESYHYSIIQINSYIQAYWDLFPKQDMTKDLRTDVLPPAFFNCLLGETPTSLHSDDPHLSIYPESLPWFADTPSLREYKTYWLERMQWAILALHTFGDKNINRSYGYHLFYAGEAVRDFYSIKEKFFKFYSLFNKSCAGDVENKSILIGLDNYNPLLKKRLIETDEFKYFFRYVIPLQLVSMSYGAFFLERSKTLESVSKISGNYADLSTMISKMTVILHNLTKPITRPPDWSNESFET